MRKRISYLLFILPMLYGVCLFSDDSIEKVNIEETSNKISLIKKIIILDDNKKQNEIDSDIVIDTEMPQNAKDELTFVLENKYIKKAITAQTFEFLKEDIFKYYKQHLNKDISVNIPIQDSENGIVTILISEKEEKKELIVPIQTIVLLSSHKETNDICFASKKGVIIEDIDIPGDETDLIHILESKYMKKNITKQILLDIKKDIIMYFKDVGRPVVAVTIPKQNISEGILKFVIVEAVLGKISIENNRYFKDKYFEKYISLIPGKEINEKELLKDLNFINLNPYINADVIYAPGEEPGSTDIDIYVNEMRPIRVFYGAENTGLDLIGRNRYFMGAHFGNLFNLGHIFSYQFTKSFKPHGFRAHTVQYTLPFNWKHMLYLYGGASKVQGSIPLFVTSENAGRSYQGSLRYSIPFISFDGVINDLQFGFDFKRTDNTAEFDAQIVTREKVYTNLTQLMLQYTLNYSTEKFRLSLDLAGYCSPGKWLKDQSNTTYRKMRQHSRNEYFYSMSSLSMMAYLPGDFTLSGNVQLQLSTQNLLASEQIGIGGYNTVRGYDERVISADNGTIVSSEIRSPSFGVLNNIVSKKIPDHMQLLTFIDYGKGWLHKTDTGSLSSIYIWSMGYGLRYVINPFFDLRLDYGYKMAKKSLFNQGKGKLHFGVKISF